MPSRAVSGSRVSADADALDGLSNEEIAFFYQSLASARDQLGDVTKSISRDFSIGPRGPWIIGVMGRGDASPHELARISRVGRSLITVELERLTAAGLILYEKDPLDRRRVKLSLTPLGRTVYARLGEELKRMLCIRLKGYSKEDVLRFSKMLHHFSIRK